MHCRKEILSIPYAGIIIRHHTGCLVVMQSLCLLVIYHCFEHGNSKKTFTSFWYPAVAYGGSLLGFPCKRHDAAHSNPQQFLQFSIVSNCWQLLAKCTKRKWGRVHTYQRPRHRYNGGSTDSCSAQPSGEAATTSAKALLQLRLAPKGLLFKNP